MCQKSLEYGLIFRDTSCELKANYFQILTWTATVTASDPTMAPLVVLQMVIFGVWCSNLLAGALADDAEYVPDSPADHSPLSFEDSLRLRGKEDSIEWLDSDTVVLRGHDSDSD